MHTHTIPPPQWRTVLDSLSRVYDGATATLEVLDPNLGAQAEVEEVPLRGITYDAGGIEIDFQTRDGGHLVHRIAHPKSVQVEEADNGFVVAIQFDSDNDPRNVLRLHSPVASKLLPMAKE